MKLINNIRRFIENISRWFSYFPTLWKVYDFDYSSILSVERQQIKRVRDSVSHFRNHVNWQQDVASMNLALKLLDIIEENGESTTSKGGDITFNDDKTLTLDPNTTWELKKYVNTRNANRFYPSCNMKMCEDPKSGAMYRDHLRIEKAWHIYHKLRQYKLRSWWD